MGRRLVRVRVVRPQVEYCRTESRDDVAAVRTEDRGPPLGCGQHVGRASRMTHSSPCCGHHRCSSSHTRVRRRADAGRNALSGIPRTAEPMQPDDIGHTLAVRHRESARPLPSLSTPGMREAGCQMPRQRSALGGTAELGEAPRSRRKSADWRSRRGNSSAVQANSVSAQPLSLRW